MILDSSAVVAILLDQPERDALLARLGLATRVGIGAPTQCETGIVLSFRLGLDARALLSRFLAEAEAQVIPFGAEHYGVALEAWLRYGKGRHPAGLNFGDCLAYATARCARTPLLCVGDDFPRTDLELA